MNMGIDIGLIGSAASIRQSAALLGAIASDARVLSLGELDSAVQALEALSCDLLLVEATDPALPGYLRLHEVAAGATWIALDCVDDVDRVPQWLALGAGACLPLDGLTARTLHRSIAQALSQRAAAAYVNAQRDDLFAVFDSTPLPMWVFDTVTLRFLAVNAAALRAYGYSREAFLQLSLYDLRAPEEHEALAALVHAPLPAQSPPSLWRHRTASGRRFMVEITAQELRYGGRAARLVLARDVTAQRQAIHSIEASERRFRDLFEQSLGLICTHDLDGLLLSVNPAAATALGYRVAELVGCSMRQVIPTSLHAHFNGYLQRIARNRADSGLLYVQHRDGETRIWEYNNRVLIDEDGEPFVMGHSLDVTEHRLYEHRLREQQAELEAVNDGSPLGLFRAGLSGGWNYVNRAFERIAGLRGDEARGQGWQRALHPDDRSRVAAEWDAAVAQRRRFQARLRFRHGSEQTVWASIQAAPLVVDGEVKGFAGSIEDVSARHFAEEQLRRNEQRLRTITDALPAMIAYVDGAQRYQFANVAYEQFYGGSGSVVGRQLRQVLGEAAYTRRHPYLEQALRGQRSLFEDEDERGGDAVVLEISYIPQWDEERRQVLGVHVMAQDITRQKADEQRWIQAAERDSLTGLSNRAGFLVRLERAIARSRDQRSLLVVMYLDVDRFKQINDRHGHAAGDAILKLFAQRLRAVLRPSDVIARLGGDEFTVIIEGMRRSQYASAAAAKIVAAMRKPFVLDEPALTLSVSTSVGVALAQNEELDVAQLLARADAALYEAKQAGRDGYRVRGSEAGTEQQRPDPPASQLG